ncbi:MAG: FxLYD domain-containing protein [Acidobacteriota bacterium]
MASSLGVNPVGSGKPAPRGVSPALIVVLALAAVALLAGWLLVRGGPRPKPAPVLSPEARAYIRAGSLKLSEVGMGAKESFARQTVVEITGKITNDGDRPIKLVDITCVFRDPAGRVVLRDPASIVNAKMGGLMPGETKDFRLAFDTIPESWNQALPELVIAQILFG